MTTRELYDRYMDARINTQRADLECSEAWRKLCRYGHLGLESDARLQREYDEAAARRRECERREHEAYTAYLQAVTRERKRATAAQGV
jgi:hypothetical protein